MTVTPDGGGGAPASFGAGDLVTFPAGMSCTCARWDVGCLCVKLAVESGAVVAWSGKKARRRPQRFTPPFLRPCTRNRWDVKKTVKKHYNFH